MKTEVETRTAIRAIPHKAMRTAVRAITAEVTDHEDARDNAFEALQRAKTPRREMLGALGYSPFKQTSWVDLALDLADKADKVATGLGHPYTTHSN